MLLVETGDGSTVRHSTLPVSASCAQYRRLMSPMKMRSPAVASMELLVGMGPIGQCVISPVSMFTLASPFISSILPPGIGSPTRLSGCPGVLPSEGLPAVIRRQLLMYGTYRLL